MRVLIVDDETLARSILSEHLQQLPDVEIVGQAANGFEAVKLAEELNPDLMFLDIQMPKLSGFEVLELLGERAPAVIFTTAFDEYALQAFESEAVAYLLKPIRAEKLKAALAKAGRLTRPQLQLVASAARETTRRSHIGARGREGLKLIPVDEVLFFHADQKYTTVKHLHGEDLIEGSLKSLEEEFVADFVRIHRNTLVNTKYLERITRDASGQHFVHLRGHAEPLEVSRRMAGDLKDRFRI